MANIVDLFDVEGGPGRSRIQRPPSPRTRDRIERHVAALEAHEAQDVVVKTARGAEKLEALYVARQEIAAEAASLLWTRLNATPGSREIGRTCSRRVAALADIAALTVTIARADPGAPSAETARRVCRLLLDEVETAAAEVLSAEATVGFAEALRRRLDPGLEQLIGLP